MPQAGELPDLGPEVAWPPLVAIPGPLLMPEDQPRRLAAPGGDPRPAPDEGVKKTKSHLTT
jgi:hypothetical protein